MAIETLKAHAHLQEGVKVRIHAREFEIRADEPENLGGTNTAMNPAEIVLGALGACQSIVARSYAEKFGIELEEFWVELEGDIDTDGFMNKSDVRPGFGEIRYTFHLKTNATPEKSAEFIDFLESKCPIGDSLSQPVKLVRKEIILN